MFVDGPRHPSDFLEYDREEGILRWRILPPSMFKEGGYSAERNCKAWNGRQGGKEAFTALCNHGYKQGNYYGVHLRAHKLIWMMEFDRVPTGRIDYIDGDRTNIRLGNLREVSSAVDGRNAAMKRHNTSGHNGVSFDKARGKWRAAIKVSGTQKFLGRFSDKGSAIAAYESAKARYGFSDRHGTEKVSNPPANHSKP